MVELTVLTPPPAGASGYAINNQGWVAGECNNATDRYQPALWRGEAIIEVAKGHGGLYGQANDVNDQGEVIGNVIYETAPGDTYWKPFVWNDGSLEWLDGPFGDNLSRSASAINESGWIAGGATTPERNSMALIWRDGEIIDLGYLYDPGVNGATDINDVGQVTGITPGLFGSQAFLWEDGVMRDIHTYGDESTPSAINNFGEVVGYNKPVWYIDEIVAFRWTEAEGMVDLNTRIPPFTNYHLDYARDINDFGQVVIFASHVARNPALALLLTPVHASISMLPASGALISGYDVVLVAQNATPGKRVYFSWSEVGGGTYIPGCTLQENALQLQNPMSLGSAIADARGVARLRRHIPPAAQGKTLLVQAVVPGECAVSELMVYTIE